MATYETLNVSCLKEQAMPLEIFRGSVSYVALTLKVADRLENEMGGGSQDLRRQYLATHFCPSLNCSVSKVRLGIVSHL